MRAVLDDSSHEKTHLMFTSSVLRVDGAGKSATGILRRFANRAGEEEARLSFTNLQEVHKLAEACQGTLPDPSDSEWACLGRLAYWKAGGEYSDGVEFRDAY